MRGLVGGGWKMGRELIWEQKGMKELVFCRKLRTGSGGWRQVVQAKGERNVGEVEEVDDAKYFKRLGKTVNPYWVENAHKVFEQLNWKRLVDPRRRMGLEEDFRRRYADVDLEKIGRLWKDRGDCEGEKRRRLTEELVKEGLWVPNDTHPEALGIEGEVPKEIRLVGTPRSENEVMEFSKVKKSNNS